MSKKPYTIHLDDMNIKELLDHLIKWRASFDMSHVEIRPTNKKDYAILSTDELYRRMDWLIQRVNQLEEKMKESTT